MGGSGLSIALTNQALVEIAAYCVASWAMKRKQHNTPTIRRIIGGQLRSLSSLTRFLLEHPRYALTNGDWILNLSRWWPTLDYYRSNLGSDNPWVSYRALEWLIENVTREQRIYEFGSGGSTIFFASRAKEIVSVEHDREWHQILSQMLKQRGLSNCDYQLAEPEEQLGPAVEYGAKSYSSNFRPELNRNLSFRKYVTSIDRYPERSFDLVFIDGRARASCVTHALPRIKAGGCLVLDNSERSEYATIHRALKQYQRLDLSGVGPARTVPWQTSVWRIEE